jgi:phosphate-selective porin OprO and OprP
MRDTLIIRRARLGVDLEFDDDWDFLVEYDFAGDRVTANDVRLRYGLPRGSLILGQTKIPMGLNELTGSNDITFIERASNSNAIVVARRLGLSYHLFEDHYSFQTMVYTRRIGPDTPTGDSPLGAAGRLVLNPIRQDGQLLHLGASIAAEDFSGQQGIGFSDYPEARPGDQRLIDTGDLDDATGTLRYGLEAAYQRGPFSAETEYLSLNTDRANNSNPRFNGYHIQASYVLTGESRSYEEGNFGSITPSGQGGAWEVAARFSSTDLNDGGAIGGKQRNITLGLNYYLNSNIRFMANLIRSDIQDGVNGDEALTIALVRAQAHF